MRPAASSSAIRSISAASSSSSTDLAVLSRGPRQLLRVDRRTPERMIGHVAVGVAEVDAVGVERRAERAAGVARRGRDEDALEAGLGEDAGVGARR